MNRYKGNRNKDLCGGLLTITVGIAAATAGFDYHVGTVRHMGPGFFPIAVGLLMVLVGALMVITAFRLGAASLSEQPVRTRASFPDPRGASCLIAGLILFVVCGKFFGLLPATFAIVFVSAMGDHKNTCKDAAILALALCVVAVLVFWWGLKVQLPLINRWGLGT